MNDVSLILVAEGQERHVLGARQHERRVDLVHQHGDAMPLAEVGRGPQLLADQTLPVGLCGLHSR